MPKTLRTSAAAVVAAVLALSLVTAAPAGASVRPTRTQHMSHARALAALEAVRDALGGGSAYAGDLTLLLRDLRLARSALTRAERASADAYLARPSVSSSCTGTVATSGPFCVHYKTGVLAGADEATPEQAQLTADTLQAVWNREIGALGFRAPPGDGDEYFDVYLLDAGSQGYYGYCAPDHDTAHSSSYCVLDNDFAPDQFGGALPVNSLRVTAAHEFFHAIQFGYDTFEDIWLMEGSAVWAEEQVYPRINDYLQYLKFSAIPHPRVPIDYIGSGSDLFYRYGAVLFWKFLSGQFHDTGIVRRVWELADGSRYSLQAVSAALTERQWTFRRAFTRFGSWNTRPNGSYDDRALYPAPAWWQVVRLGRHHRDTRTHHVLLDHLTNATTLIRPATRLPRRTHLRIVVDGPGLGRMPAANVQVRRRDGSVRYLDIALDRTGDGVLRVRFDPRRVAAVVVTVSNASTRMHNCGFDPEYLYACGGEAVDDDQTFAVRARLRLPRR